MPIKAVWFVLVFVCVRLQVPNQCLPGMLTEPQTATGKCDPVLCFALNMIDFKVKLSANNIYVGVWVCCECGLLVTAVFISVQQVLFIFLLLLRGQRSAQCQGRVTSCHSDKCELIAYLSMPADTGPESKDTVSIIVLRQKHILLLFYIILI